jgi:hypothetical protein
VRRSYATAVTLLRWRKSVQCPSYNGSGNTTDKRPVWQTGTLCTLSSQGEQHERRAGEWAADVVCADCPSSYIRSTRSNTFHVELGHTCMLGAV